MSEITISKIGFCKYRFNNGTPENWTVPVDIQEGRGVQFWFTYSWKNSRTCEINNIKWKPIKFTIDDQNNKIVEWNELVDDVFKQPDEVTIMFNGESLDFNQDTDRHTNIYFGGYTDIPIKDRCYIYDYHATSNRYVAPQDITLPLSYESDNNYIVASFKYEYTDAIKNITYYVDIPNIKIPKTSKYEHNVVFTEDGVNELIKNIKEYPITKVEEITDTSTWNDYTEGKPCLKITYGDTTKIFNGYKKANGTNQTQTTTGFQYVPVGSNITFPNETSPLPANQATGTIRININGVTHEIPVYGLAGTGSGGINLNGTTTVGGDLIPMVDSQPASGGGYNLGSDKKQWNILYTRAAIFGNVDENDGQSDAASNVRPYADFTGSLGTSNYHWNNLYSRCGIFASKENNYSYLILKKSNQEIKKGDENPSPENERYYGIIYFGESDLTTADKKNSLARIVSYQNPNYSDASSSDYAYRNEPILELNCFENAKNSTNACTLKLVYQSTSTIPSAATSGSYYSYNARGLLDGVFRADKVFNAVFNDYAEYRTTIDLTPGHVVIDNDDGSLSCSSQRLQPGAQVISDTFGHSMGETDTAKTPLAVAGRVLVYTYQPRENYHAGMAVCSAPNGTVDIMTREEIRDYPDCIVGIVSEIPQYETWGSDNIKVDGRIWIKVK